MCTIACRGIRQLAFNDHRPAGFEKRLHFTVSNRMALFFRAAGQLMEFFNVIARRSRSLNMLIMSTCIIDVHIASKRDMTAFT